MTKLKFFTPFKTVSVSVLALMSLSAAFAAHAKVSKTDDGKAFMSQAEDAELLGDYLAGTYANLIEDSKAREKYYSRAFEADPTNVKIGRRAITSALAAGDFEKAKDLAKDVYAVDDTESMAEAILAIDAFERGKNKTTKKYLDPNSADITMGIVMALTNGWNEYERGNDDKAREAFNQQASRPYFGDLGKLQIAKLEALEDNIDAANLAFDALKDTPQSRVETVLATARFYANSGQESKALERLESYIDETGLESGPIKEYAARLGEGKKIDKPLEPKAQLSRALTDPSYEFFLRNRAPDAAEVYLRLALHLDPENEKAQLWLASLLESTDRAKEAMEIYQSFPESSAYVISARLSEANIYFDRDEDEKALKVLEDVNEGHETFVTREALGRARLIREKYEDALPIYTDIIESMSEAEIEKNTQPLYFRGIIYERLKQWSKAEADFLRVLEIEPENADALNYLGYTWVDRGENLERAFEMIRKAVELEPQSGAIIDSLGWAHYKLGQYEEAKTQLEKAVELSPSSATIVDHLGDVYWKIGRHREAGYQWERALLYDPTDEERETIESKLKSGLISAEAAP